MLSKSKLIGTLADLPEHFTLDELLDRIMLLHKIEVGLEQSQNGQVVSMSDAKTALSQWLQ